MFLIRIAGVFALEELGDVHLGFYFQFGRVFRPEVFYFSFQLLVFSSEYPYGVDVFLVQFDEYSNFVQYLLSFLVNVCGDDLALAFYVDALLDLLI